MAGPQTSYADSSSSSVGMTQGAKQSGLNIAAPMATPSWLTTRLSGDVASNAATLPLLVAVVAAVAALVLLRKGR